ncbi:MAG: L-threonylcarbamoyladenylate synthase [Candidatus Bipolaricaulis anaerobius]|jgi:L-threonylcarbamoyladenylate synthase|uniref:Threonylcarbamoyl-AMP synthase n=1 Tax=Candidatus Bipolaricaulis anaerobius TaxID=2026885 RepID=A0A2X3KUD8_9BACT|nr:L-threonylcarbamoyladenylate synthase [Candidatus Bipolaricaulis anaerobius]MBP7726727.1 threonylcarbamoyl-AMP synthase [Candidatus Bipolaricaulis sp.]MDD3748013.1 L-threonylcarbamoyladenylate synthase [Candidatus Bipolaricaulis anaerobius]MDD5763904.1 L-threonylcarbamoyladenylate synthase [Candidatus Bipolaricaulis anaerobius]SQD92228.1 Threonylcarbamoyl-AMP synthase [Candidatus Bipolaricaulis anaerobius]HOD73279.1 L-threonylcarbamoyladenylate synthase [Candidatus Bipolaricaulis anaerobius
METQLLAPDEEGIVAAAAVIRRQGIVAFPTETVYGLGADAMVARAVARVFAAKERPRFDPVIVHVASPEDVGTLWTEVPPLARRLMETFWPGPLTLVLPRRRRVPAIVTAGLPTVAVRMPDHPVALALIRAAGRPIAAPSANRFGRLSPTHHDDVLSQLAGQVDAVIAGGPTPVGIESTVVSLAEEVPVVLRPGGTPLEALREVIPELRTAPPLGPSASPGTLPRHYLPATPLFLLDHGPVPERSEQVDRLACGFLAFREEWSGFGRVEVLSPGGDLVEAGARFFSTLHRLDRAGLAAIIAEPIREEGLGVAMMDRLRRAAAGRAYLGEGQVWMARN